MPVHVLDLRGLHPSAVGGDDPQQGGDRGSGAVLRHQSVSLLPAAPVAAVARHVDHRELGYDLAEEDHARAADRRRCPHARLIGATAHVPVLHWFREG
jgi:hypothetical protein